MTRFLDVAYQNQDSLDHKSWSAIAAEAELANIPRFAKCMDSDVPDDHIKQGLTVARQMRLAGTPSVFLNEVRFPAPPSEAQLDSAIKALTFR